MTTKERLHQLVDQLPESEIATAERVLAALRAAASGEVDPVLWTLLTAPEDDEPETPEERAAVAEARAEWRAGKAVSQEEAERILFGNDGQD